MPTCPSCRHTWTTPKRPRPQPAAALISTAELSIAELYKYYKRTAAAEDIAFVRRVAPYVVLPDPCTPAQAFQAFREQSKPSWKRQRPDEARFWRWHTRSARQARGRE